MIGLSPSSIGTFVRCPRCFWNDKNRKIKQPEGIKASLPKGLDGMMKNFVDGCVASGTPVPWLADIPGNASPFRDRIRLKKFMQWSTFQVVVTLPGIGDVKCWGNVDDVIEHADGRVSPWDFKTKGSEPDADYGEKYYQTQLDMYHLLLEGQNLQCTGLGYLSYGWPVRIEPDGMMVWGWKNLILKTDPGRATALMTEAVQCLAGPEPEASLACDYCTFIERRSPAVAAPMTAPAKVKKGK